ncbi:MAG: aconitase X catalytic domain-containing protein [Actinobacteria bacterium]|nr:aconitase X catalytic domain-containing protein [Actinomycetota bacterium]
MSAAAPLELTAEQRAVREGEAGAAAALAMRVVCRMAGVAGARRLRPIASAHIDGCIYFGVSMLDFAARLVELGARVTVPTTTNVGSIDLIHPELYRGPATTAAAARRLMDAYLAMGCEATWTCAPYQLRARPGLGEHVCWAESNAIVFANSVLGARTERYGDFMDICAAIVGLVPDAGLHRDENRRGEVVFDLSGLGEGLLRSDAFHPALGHLVGKEAEGEVPVIVGLPADCDEDQLKAIGASAASAGGVAMFHAVGLTPEAPTLAAALGGATERRRVEVSAAMVRGARDALGAMPPGTALDAVCVGTPHFSLTEFAKLDAALADVDPAELVAPLYVSTGRWVWEEARRRGHLERAERLGVTVVVDTCTYNTRILPEEARRAMTNSGKWAYYAPGNIGVDVAFGSLRECVLSAAAGAVVREEGAWT